MASAALRKPDPVLRDRTGFGGALPPAFAADGRKGAAHCPECAGETTISICPVCHSRLPVHFGKVGSRLIVPVGAKEAGKTVFMTVLVHELMHQTGQRFNAAITGADDFTRHRFASDYERPLYRESRLLPPTAVGGAYDQAPLVFHFATEAPRRLNGRLGHAGAFGNGDPKRTLLSFFDTAGEDLHSQQSIEQNVRYLGAADGVLLLLDPLQMRGARGLVAPGTRLPTSAADDDPATVLRTRHRSPARQRGEQARREDQQAAGHRVHQDGHAHARPEEDEPAAAGPRPRSRTSTSATAWRCTPRSSGCWPGGREPGSTRSPS